MKLRVQYNGWNGATGFFRNRPLLDTITELLTGESPRVLFHAVSIGAEAYSFAIYCQMQGICCRALHATDISPEFLEIAKLAQYPSLIAQGLSEEEKRYFEPRGSVWSPIKAIRDAVTFLPACSFVDSDFNESYDVVFVMNALTYVTPDIQSRTIARVAKYNTRYLVLTAFHQQTIKSDLTRAGYVPVTDRQREIHTAWKDRILAHGQVEHTWQLPTYSEIADFDYKYCAIFRK